MTPTQQSAAIEAIIDAAIRWISEDADKPDAVPEEWQTVIPMLKAMPGTLDTLKKIKALAGAKTISPGFCLPHIEDMAHGAIEAAAQPPKDAIPGLTRYSVLLGYPDYLDVDGTETFYDFVDAPNAETAIAEIRRRAVAAQEETDIDPTDFALLLVTEGHNRALVVAT
jgi:hypothetical protein